MWSLGNEIFQQLIDGNVTGQYPEVAKKLITWTGEEDATRYVTFGDNQVKSNVWADNNQVNTALVFAEAAKYGVPGGLVGFNYGSSGQISNGHSRGWLVYGSETASSVNSRGVYDRKNSNSDNGSGDRRLTSYDKSAVGWGHLASAGLWITMQQEFNAGEFVWTGFDYIGEPTPYNWQGTGANGTWPNIAKNSYFGIIDTAGIRETNDTIESLGIERTFQKLEQAEIVLWMIDATDATSQMNQLSGQILPRLERKHLILVFNKADLLGTAHSDEVLSAASSIIPDAECIFISAKKRQNTDVLQKKLIAAANLPTITQNDVIVTNARHYEALTHALEAIGRVQQGLANNLSGDFVAQDIRECIFHLSDIAGEVTNDMVLQNIFQHFCIGK